MSGFALSSLRQKAISSAIAATAVMPRMVLKLAGRIVMSTPLASEIVSAVSFSNRSFRFGAVAKMPGDEVEGLRSLRRAGGQDRQRAALAWR